MNNIIQNALQTPDGTIIISRDVHDYQSHEEYFVDGGHEYIRYGYPVGGMYDFIPLFLYEDDSFEKKKNNLLWGTYGIKGGDPLKWVKFIDCNTEHLNNILKIKIPPLYVEVIESILLDRRIKKIKKIKENVQPILR